MMVTLAMVSHVLISMNALMVHTTVTVMLNVKTQLDHLAVVVTVDTAITAIHTMQLVPTLTDLLHAAAMKASPEMEQRVLL